MNEIKTFTNSEFGEVRTTGRGKRVDDNGGIA